MREVMAMAVRDKHIDIGDGTSGAGRARDHCSDEHKTDVATFKAEKRGVSAYV